MILSSLHLGYQATPKAIIHDIRPTLGPVAFPHGHHKLRGVDSIPVGPFDRLPTPSLALYHAPHSCSIHGRRWPLSISSWRKRCSYTLSATLSLPDLTETARRSGSVLHSLLLRLWLLRRFPPRCQAAPNKASSVSLTALRSFLAPEPAHSTRITRYTDVVGLTPRLFMVSRRWSTLPCNTPSRSFPGPNTSVGLVRRRSPHCRTYRPDGS